MSTGFFIVLGAIAGGVGVVAACAAGVAIWIFATRPKGQRTPINRQWRG